MSTGDGKNALKITIWTVVGTVVVALISGFVSVGVQLITVNGSDQGTRPSDLPSSSSNSPTSPPITPSTPPSRAPAARPDDDLARTHFEITLDEFNLVGEVVVKGDGQIAASGHVNPTAAAKAEKCRLVVKFEPMNKAGDPVGEAQFRRCETDGPEQDHPAFGPVTFENDQNIAYVKVTGSLDGREAPAEYCRILEDVCREARKFWWPYN
ncbi:hypothetical protein [Actinophytocola algeriensis]|uniref:Uncharacterized protein n=1 Tax=Actinophytocola algeriensis TaxID=1768010 RepID=A0A7W7QBG4_9PSEU|nr:hypothetical protein [Actinophytocola algeriensis]MBB4910580.1 hypothetical protein [Actinophytocola algeriensis]MBE1480431.1 hypothetical protein [Actinophytocola algeriensis]